MTLGEEVAPGTGRLQISDLVRTGKRCPGPKQATLAAWPTRVQVACDLSRAEALGNSFPTGATVWVRSVTYKVIVTPWL